VQRELFELERAAQIRLEREPLDRLRLHVLAEDVERVLAFLFR